MKPMELNEEVIKEIINRGNSQRNSDCGNDVILDAWEWDILMKKLGVSTFDT